MIVRSIPFELDSASASDGGGLRLSGYAAVFNSITRIDSYEGRFDEQIAPGAFNKTIRTRLPKLQFDHGQHPLLGSLPIGQISALREDPQGLWVEADLHDNWLTEPVRDAIASGSVDGMSFRFSVPKGKDTWDRTGEVPMRTIREVNCAELGPVVFPAYTDTSVSVRSVAESLTRAMAHVVEEFDEPHPLEEVEHQAQLVELLDDIRVRIAADDLTEEEREALTGLAVDLAGLDPAEPQGTGEEAAEASALQSQQLSSEREQHPDGTRAHSREAAILRLLTLKGTGI